MLNVFLLISELGSSPEAGTVRVLALELPRDRFTVSVGVLGATDGPVADELRAANIPVHSLPVQHGFDLSGIRKLKRTVGEAKTTVLHAFGCNAARATRLLVQSLGEEGNSPKLVVSGAALPESGLAGWCAARQIRRADRVVALTWADGERYRRIGVHGERLCRILPGTPELPPEPDRNALFRTLNVHSSSRLLLAEGRPSSGTGPKDAIVAFDMLRYNARDLFLIVCGARSQAPALEQFGRSLAFDDFRIRFPHTLDRTAVVRLATAVLVTTPQYGIDEALEAMEAGKPVIAWGTPDLSEIVDDGVTGFLVPLGDRAALAAKTRLLLEDTTLAAKMGAAGRARAAERFPLYRMVEQFARVYEEVAR